MVYYSLMHISQVLAIRAKTSPISVIKPGRFISPAQAEQFIVMVREEAKVQGVEWALIGGLAMQWHGSPRLTGNCDIAVTGPITLKDLKSSTVTEYGGRKWLAPDNSRLTTVDRRDGYQSLYREAIRESWQDDRYRVVRPEWLAAMKFACQDVDHDLDLQWLLRRGPQGLLDRQKTAQIIFQHLGGQFAETAFRKTVEESDCDLEMNGAPEIGDYP